MPPQVDAAAIRDSFPALEEPSADEMTYEAPDDGEPDTLAPRGAKSETVEAPVSSAAPAATTDSTMSVPSSTDAPPSGEAGPAPGAPEALSDEANPELDALAEEHLQQAQLWNNFVAHIESLPADQRQAAMVALGLAEPAPQQVDLGDYAPVGPLEQALAPHLADLIQAPQALRQMNTEFQQFGSELQQVLTAQGSVLDNTAVNAEIALARAEMIAELFQLELPAIESTKVLEAIRGRSGAEAAAAMRSYIRDQLKPAKEKNLERLKQANTERPRTPSNDANGVMTIERGDDMATIMAKAKGFRVG